MEIDRCLNCMEKITSYPCPRCGYDPAEAARLEFALPCGTILHGRYLVGNLLGQGGFGLTYVGFDLALQVKCAIKEYYPNGQVTREPGSTLLNWYTTPQAQELRQGGMETFLKEARKMARVAEVPQVVSVRDTFAENATAYIIMDYAEGRTLKSRLEEEGSLSWQEAEKIFTPVIQAMGRIHEAGIIHRDLSPDNLMLLPNGSVKILDLGAAKDLTVNTGVSSMQVVKSGFSPIEQYSRTGFSGPRTDVYALAATMFRSLTGNMPPAAVDRLENDTMDWDLPQLKRIPQNVIRALRNAMEVSAQERTQSMAEFLAEIQGRAEPAPKKKIQKKAPKKRHWAAIPAALLALILAIGAGVCFGFHIWLPGSCEEPEVCSICGKTRGEAFGHTWTEASCEAPKNCTLCGQTQGEALGHDWTAATCTELSVCTRCNRETGTLVPHALTDATISMPPRCTQCGVMVGHPLHNIISAGDDISMAVTNEGNVLGGGYKASVKDWQSIKAIAAARLAAGLTEDGSVMVTGDFQRWNRTMQDQVKTWSDVVYIASGGWDVVGILSDGTVVTSLIDGVDVSGWSDIVAVDMSFTHIVGLRSDGTVLTTGSGNRGAAKEAWDWTNIVGVAAGYDFTLGLKPDGTVIAAWDNEECKAQVESWTDIVAIDAGYEYAVGLKSDGTVVDVSTRTYTDVDVSDWTDIVSITASDGHVLGLKSDGTVVATGYLRGSPYNQRAIESWTGIRLPG